MRKSAEFALAPKPLSGIARYSPAWRPSMTEEKPWTGCDGSGNVIPFTTPGGSSVPAGGPGARVAAGRTARPARMTWSTDSAEAGRTAVSSPAATAEITVTTVNILDLFMVVLLSFWLSRPEGGPPGVPAAPGRRPDSRPGQIRAREPMHSGQSAWRMLSVRTPSARVRLIVVAAGAFAAVIGAGAVLVLRLINSGFEPEGRNWWILADTILGLAYLPLGAALAVRAALSSGLRSPSSGYASCCPRWRQS